MPESLNDAQLWQPIRTRLAELEKRIEQGFSGDPDELDERLQQRTREWARSMEPEQPDTFIEVLGVSLGEELYAVESRYVASQPWPFPGALMLGFMADAHADEPQAGEELEEARWFTVDELLAAKAREAGERDDEGPLLSASISIARWLIEQWLAAAVAARLR